MGIIPWPPDGLPAPQGDVDSRLRGNDGKKGPASSRLSPTLAGL